MTSSVMDICPKLVPFFKSLAIYFVVFIPHENPSITGAILKCLPILSLMIFVAWYSMNLGKQNKRFSRRIFFGLLFSCLGDLCLIWPETFDLGMLAFAIGHVNYIQAFGFQPLKPYLGALVYLIAIVGVGWLMPGLKGIMIPGVPIYAVMIGTMLWRALARIDLKQNRWTWTQICTALGAVSFVLSDLIIGIDRFKTKVSYDQVIIMGTYYAAQLGISLSIVDTIVSHEHKE